jgi:hypothetical protein
MNVGDYFTQERRGWVRLHEKGGKEHEAPCHHKLETGFETTEIMCGGRCGTDVKRFQQRELTWI